MKRALHLTGVLFVVFLYFLALSFLEPRSAYLLLLVLSLLGVGLSFWRRKGRVATAACVLAFPAGLALAPIDARVVTGQRNKGVFYLPIDYGFAPKSVDQGYCPGGCIVGRPTHALVISI
jgi:hypothetical protein